jgi:triphosphoribosyl-dephospho-CoA synthase
MRSGACGSRPAALSGAQARLLAAREAREDQIRRLANELPGGCLVVIGLSIPGEEKNRSGSGRVVGLAAALLQERCRASGIASRGRIDPPGEGSADRDGRTLGPYDALEVMAPPERAKAICVELEESLPWGRLLDLDVYVGLGASGLQEVGRNSLGLAGRRCLLCHEPARECILLRRHSSDALIERTGELLREARRSTLARDLATALERGARAELDLTPKPGLVDRQDNGSHPDLSYEAMTRSIDLLPVYYRDLIRILESVAKQSLSPPRVGRLDEAVLSRCIEAGQRAEARMFEAIGVNAHRGFIFLSGLVLLAAWETGSTDPSRLRPAIATIARRFFARATGADAESGGPMRPGGVLRGERGIGGIAAEARAGLPGVFEHAGPHLVAPTSSGDAARCQAFRAMAELMLTLEDTTAIHRCGCDGLERIHRDGACLRALLSRHEDPVPHLALWNEEYRARGLTMGGVADCLAVAMALAGCAAPAPDSAVSGRERPRPV